MLSSIDMYFRITEKFKDKKIRANMKNHISPLFNFKLKHKNNLKLIFQVLFYNNQRI